MGPLLGGWLVDGVSWRLVFLINPLAAIATAFVAHRYVPETRDEDARDRPMDAWGVIAMVIGLAGLVFALIEGPELGWSSAPVAGAAAGGLAALVLFGVREARARAPMVPPGIFRSLQFSGVNGTTLALYFVLGGAFFLLTLQLQRVHGYSAFRAGLAMAPITLLLLVLSPLAGSFADRAGPHIQMTAGPMIAAAGLALLTRVATRHSAAAAGGRHLGHGARGGCSLRRGIRPCHVDRRGAPAGGRRHRVDDRAAAPRRVAQRRLTRGVQRTPAHATLGGTAKVRVPGRRPGISRRTDR